MEGPFTDDGGERELNRSSAPVLSSTVSDRPDSWMVTLEGQSYDIAMQNNNALDMLSTQVKCYAAILALGYEFPTLDVLILAKKLGDLRQSYSRKEQEAHAVVLFKDFKPPDAMFSRDSVELRKLGSHVVLITAIQTVKHSSRFNELEARTV